MGTDIEGFAFINPNATTIMGTEEESTFKGLIVRVIEFSEHDGSALCINSKGSSLAMIDKKDLLMSFRCEVFNGVICKPGLDTLEKLAYAGKVMSRKGGYDEVVRDLVIVSSLHKGGVCDSFLFAKQ